MVSLPEKKNSSPYAPLRRLRRLEEHLLTVAKTEAGMKSGVYEKGGVKIHYEEVGSGFPLLIIPGGGLNGSTVHALSTEMHPFNPMEIFKDQFRVIAADLRNATGGKGRSTGPVEVDRPWDGFTDDQIGLMDHLGIDKFMVLGFCIGGPFIWNMLRRHGDRVVAAVLTQPSGFNPDSPDFFMKMNRKGWIPPQVSAGRLTEEQGEKFLTNMYTQPASGGGDFVFTATRDFVKSCQTPLLILPDNIAAHPYATAMEVARLAPKARVSVFPWKEAQGEGGKENLPLALRHVRDFLGAHHPGMRP